MISERFRLWLRDHAWQPFIGSQDCNYEATGNLSRLTISDLLPELPSPAELEEALRCFIDIRRSFLRAHHTWCPILLYVWHDEPAGAICISAQSNLHGGKLPFSCRIKQAPDLMSIATSYLASATLEGIPWDDLTLQFESPSGPLDFELSVYVEEIVSTSPS